MQHVISHLPVYAWPQNPSAFSSEEMEGRMESAWIRGKAGLFLFLRVWKNKPGKRNVSLCRQGIGCRLCWAR